MSSMSSVTTHDDYNSGLTSDPKFIKAIETIFHLRIEEKKLKQQLESVENRNKELENLFNDIKEDIDNDIGTNSNINVIRNKLVTSKQALKIVKEENLKLVSANAILDNSCKSKQNIIAELESNNKELIKQNQNYITIVNDLNNDKSSLELLINKLTEELTAYKTEVQSYKEQLLDNDRSIINLTNKVKSAIKSDAEKDDLINTLNNKINTLNKELKNKANTEEIKNIEYKNLLDNFNELVEKYDEQTNNYNQLQDEQNSLNSAYMNLETEYNNLQAKNQSLICDIDKYEDQKMLIASTMDKNKLLNEHIMDLESRLEEADKEMKTYKSKMIEETNSYEKELEKLRNKSKEIENEYNKYKSLYETVKIQKDSLTVQVDLLNEELIDKIEKYEDAVQKMEIAENQYNNNLQQLRKDISLLENELNNLNELHKATADTNNDLNNSKNKLEADLNDLQQIYKKLEKDYESKVKQIETIQLEYDNLTNEVSTLRKNCESEFNEKINIQRSYLESLEQKDKMIIQYKNKINELKLELTSSGAANSKIIDDYKTIIKNLEYKLESINEAHNKLTNKFSEYKTANENYRLLHATVVDKLNTIASAHKELIDTNYKLNEYMSSYKDMCSNITDNILNELNSKNNSDYITPLTEKINALVNNNNWHDNLDDSYRIITQLIEYLVNTIQNMASKNNELNVEFTDRLSNLEEIINNKTNEAKAIKLTYKELRSKYEQLFNEYSSHNYFCKTYSNIVSNPLTKFLIILPIVLSILVYIYCRYQSKIDIYYSNF